MYRNTQSNMATINRVYCFYMLSLDFISAYSVNNIDNFERDFKEFTGIIWFPKHFA